MKIVDGNMYQIESTHGTIHYGTAVSKHRTFEGQSTFTLFTGVSTLTVTEDGRLLSLDADLHWFVNSDTCYTVREVDEDRKRRYDVGVEFRRIAKTLLDIGWGRKGDVLMNGTASDALLAQVGVLGREMEKFIALLSTP